jgi:hypothetical protein
MADAKQPKCAHHDCKCDVPVDRASRGDKFCSDYCATDDGHAGHSHGCECGHPKCEAA